MTWHEIVNDTVADVPVAVTYCPLCSSGVAFERRAAGRLLDFGTSGRLYADNLVMYDRQTESLWPQLTGQAVVGVLTGTQLKAIPIGTVGWADFRTAHPDAQVLTRDTGHDRPYGQNPYAGYDDPNGELLFEPPGPGDPRLPVKERVVGIRAGGESLAVRRSWVADERLVTVTVGDTDLVVWHRAGQVSALDDSEIAGSQEIGTIGVYEPRAGSRLLSFHPVDTGFRDEQTGSTWNVLGQAVSGPLEGEQLRPYTHLDTFWFAWVAFQPDTRLLPSRGHTTTSTSPGGWGAGERSPSNTPTVLDSLRIKFVCIPRAFVRGRGPTQPDEPRTLPSNAVRIASIETPASRIWATA